MTEEILIKKSVEKLGGYGRKMKEFTPDEVLFLKDDNGKTKWKLLHTEINKNRASHCGIAFSYFMKKVNALGIKRIKKGNTAIKKKAIVEKEFYDPSEYKQYYNF